MRSCQYVDHSFSLSTCWQSRTEAISTELLLRSSPGCRGSKRIFSLLEEPRSELNRGTCIEAPLICSKPCEKLHDLFSTHRCAFVSATRHVPIEPPHQEIFSPPSLLSCCPLTSRSRAARAHVKIPRGRKSSQYCEVIRRSLGRADILSPPKFLPPLTKRVAASFETTLCKAGSSARMQSASGEKGEQIRRLLARLFFLSRGGSSCPYIMGNM